MSIVWNSQTFDIINADRPATQMIASHLLLRFINRYGIEDFHIVATHHGKSYIDNRIEIIYKVPEEKAAEDIEEDWIAYKQWLYDKAHR